MTNQIIPVSEELLSATQRANQVLQRAYEIKSQEASFRSRYAEQLHFAEEKRNKKQKRQILFPLLLALPAVPVWLIIFSILAEIPAIGSVFAGALDWFFEHAEFREFSYVLAINAAIIFVIVSLIPSGDKPYIVAAEEYEMSANNKLMEFERFVESNKQHVTIIAQKYRYPKASSFIVELFELGRASTLPEAYDKLEEQLHRWNMEESMSTMIQSQIAMLNVLKDIETNTYWS